MRTHGSPSTIIRLTATIAAVVSVALAAMVSAAAAAPAVPAASILAKQPVLFEANRGQADPGVKFLTTGPGARTYLRATGATVDLRTTRPLARRLPQSNVEVSLRRGDPSEATKRTGPVVEMKFVGADPLAPAVTGEVQRARVSYLHGRDRTKRITDVPTYAQVRFKEIYAGVDVVYHARGHRQVEYEFIVAPNADPRRITLEFGGVDRVAIAADGDLLLRAGGRELRHRKPYVYQEIRGTRVPVAGRYVVIGPRRVGFEIPAYVGQQALVIDPVFDVIAAGGIGTGSAVDADGNTIFVGYAEAGLTGADQNLYGGGIDVFVAKVDAASNLLWVTYLGGEGNEFPNAVTVDAARNIYVTGDTRSSNFPATHGTFQGGTCLVVIYLVPCPDAFLAKFSPNGSLAYSTLVGGAGAATPSRVGVDFGQAVVVDGVGNAYLAGGAAPGTVAPATYFGYAGVASSGALGGDADIFVVKVDATGAVVWMRVIGGSGSDNANGMALDADGNVILTGDTYGTGTAPGDNDLGQVTTDASQPAYGGGVADAFVAKLSPTGSLLYLSFLGGSSDDFGFGIAAGSMILIGATYSSDFGVTGNAVQNAISPPPCDLVNDPECVQTADVYLAKFPTSSGGTTPLQPVFSTFFGGPGEDYASGVAVSAAGEVYVAGFTTSDSFAPALAPTEQPVGTVDVTVGEEVFAAPQVFVTKLIVPESVSEPAVVVYTAPVDAGLVGNGVSVALTPSGDATLSGVVSGGDGGAGGAGVVLPDARKYATLDVQPTVNASKTAAGKSRGTIPVVILSSAAFDPMKVDVATLRFGRLGSETAPVRCDPPADKNKDRTKDLTCHFDAVASGFLATDVLARATGTLVGGTEFLATGPIRTTPASGTPAPK